MLKKLIISAVLVCFSFGFAQAVEPIAYVGGQVIIPDKNTEDLGLGNMLCFGYRLGPNIIGWLLNYEAFKTNEGISKDNFYAGFTYHSNRLFSLFTLPVGLYGTVEPGFEKQSGEKTKFDVLRNGGFWFELGPETTGWIGGGISGDVYSIDVGFSFVIR